MRFRVETVHSITRMGEVQTIVSFVADSYFDNLEPLTDGDNVRFNITYIGHPHHKVGDNFDLVPHV